MRVVSVADRRAVLSALPGFRAAFQRACIIAHPSMNPTGDENFLRSLNAYVRANDCADVVEALRQSGSIT